MQGKIDEHMMAPGGGLMPNIDGGYPVLYFAELGRGELDGPFCAPCAGDPEHRVTCWVAFYEGLPEFCEGCNAQIDSAYGDPDGESS